MKRRRGFTLTEILVILAILAILAALLFPALIRAKGRAQETRCASNLRQLFIAVELYRQDWETGEAGAFPAMGYPTPERYGDIQWKLFKAGWEICPAAQQFRVPIGYFCLPAFQADYAQYAERVGSSAYVIVDYNHNDPSGLEFLYANKTIHVTGVRADGSIRSFRARGSMSYALSPFWSGH